MKICINFLETGQKKIKKINPVTQKLIRNLSKSSCNGKTNRGSFPGLSSQKMTPLFFHFFSEFFQFLGYFFFRQACNFKDENLKADSSSSLFGSVAQKNSNDRKHLSE